MRYPPKTIKDFVHNQSIKEKAPINDNGFLALSCCVYRIFQTYKQLIYMGQNMRHEKPMLISTRKLNEQSLNKQSIYSKQRAYKVNYRQCSMFMSLSWLWLFLPRHKPLSSLKAIPTSLRLK